MKVRTLKPTAPGRIPPSLIDRALRSVHVLAKPSGRWEVRTLGPKGVAQRFSVKDDAVQFARRLARSATREIVVHNRDGRIVTVSSG